MRVAFLLLVCAACGPSSLVIGADEDPNKGNAPKKDSGSTTVVTEKEDSGYTSDAGLLDAGHTDCPTSGDGQIYLMTSDLDLLAFSPKTLAFTALTKLACPAGLGAVPQALAIDRYRNAYVMYASPPTQAGTALTFEGIYRVDTMAGGCTKTSLNTDWNTFKPDGLFGMAFASVHGGAEEALYAADGTLAKFDFYKNVPISIGGFDTAHSRVVLTGAGDGRLFAYLPQSIAWGASTIVELEKNTGQVISREHIDIGASTNAAIAMAFYGGNLYLFVGSQNGGSQIHRYGLHDQRVSYIGARPGTTFLGAGVSTCAPTH